jgi:hypothetical protein
MGRKRRDLFVLVPAPGRDMHSEIADDFRATGTGPMA